MRARLVVVLAILLAALVVAPGLARGDGPRRAAPATTYTVAPGDTLWSIARRVAPGRDPRPVIDRLIEANHLEGGLQAGQQLTVVLPG